jgi:hypothetical protein
MKAIYPFVFLSGILFLVVSCNISSNKKSGDMKMQCEVTGSGRPMVLVPGGLTGWASWEPFVEGFEEKRTVIRMQLLGVQWGLEDRFLPEDHSIKTESEALAATLDSLDYKMP